MGCSEPGHDVVLPPAVLRGAGEGPVDPAAVTQPPSLEAICGQTESSGHLKALVMARALAKTCMHSPPAWPKHLHNPCSEWPRLAYKRCISTLHMTGGSASKARTPQTSYKIRAICSDIIPGSLHSAGVDSSFRYEVITPTASESQISNHQRVWPWPGS